MDSWHDRHVLVTGASRGLGLEFARQLASRGAIVVATCRSPQRAAELQSLATMCDRVRVAELDTSKPETANALASQIETLDVLINNAGIATSNHPDDPITRNDTDELLRVLRTNVAGTITTTNAFLPALRNGEKKIIAMLSSDLGSIEGTFVAQSATVQAGGVSSYRISKAGVNMAGRIFAAELADEGFTVVALSPGWVATDMGSSGGRTAPLTPEQSISDCLNVIATLTREDNGKFIRHDGINLPW